MKEYKLKSGNILKIIHDEFAQSPDEWGDDGLFLVYDHRQFSADRKGFDPKDIFERGYIQFQLLEYLKDKDINNLKDFEQEEINEYQSQIDDYPAFEDDYFIFPIDAYIHSGVHLSLANNTDYPDRRWDVSTSGYVLVKKDEIQDDEWRNKCHKGKSEEEISRHLAEGLIETWNQYLSGDIYGFQILKPIKTYTITEESLDKIVADSFINKARLLEIAEEKIEYEEIDSCWGFYGDDIKTNGILEHIQDEIIEDGN